MLTSKAGLLTETVGPTLQVTIDRPRQLNAVLTETLDEIAAALDRHASDPQIRAAVLSGSGRAFCTGADLNTVSFDEPLTVDMVEAANRVVTAIGRFPHPVIGAVRGPAAGVGVSLALACDLTVATESSYFLPAFTQVGLMPDGGATALVAASIGRARAMRTMLLAERIDAATAAETGLIAAIYPDDEFDGRLEDLLHRITSGPAAAFAETKAAINAATLGHLPDALDRESAGQATLLPSADFEEGITAFREKRPARFAAATPSQTLEQR